MAALAPLKSFTGYTDDYGTVFKVEAQTAITSQAKLGETALGGTEKRLPRGIKKRFTTVHNAANNVSRKVTVYSDTAPILSSGTSVNLNHYPTGGPLNSFAFLSNGSFVSEVRPRGIAT